MMKFSGFAVWYCLVILSLLCLGRIEETEAVTCNAAELSPCLPAIVNGSPPTEQCCQKAREHESCICTYMKDPQFGKYFESPNARKIVQACGLNWPKC
ncbi:hypothetical protein ACH5RR_019502 [Cinchona calisaya]|uniref:Bifunctional inhibitor/plant lipid transfer protein/seed storage helical domain-containing protein n=1 Tax=Cinchona calisaya TaxID=153742 RepID=A0ABD2ZQ14_9GENT